MSIYSILCEASGALSGKGNGSSSSGTSGGGYLNTPYAWEAPESFDVTEETTFTHVVSPYNPDDVGIVPLPRNESISDAEILKQTGGMWEKLGKISASLLTSFPGSTPYMVALGRIPTTFLIPDVNPETNLPSKSGGSGAVIPPSEAKGPTPTPKPDPKPDPKWDENDPFAWWKMLLGIKPAPYSFVPPDTPPDTEPPPSGEEDTFWDNFKTSRTPFGDMLDNFTGEEKDKINWPLIGLIGGGVLLLILIIK